MIAKLAYLTTPAPGVFIFNYQVEGGELQRVEISKAHLANVLIDGASVALREYSASNEGKHERDTGRQFERADQVDRGED